MKEVAGLLSPGDFDAVKYLFIVRRRFSISSRG